jgi:hypothetical protein
MVLQLDRETDVLIQQIAEAGRYRDAREVVQEAVRQPDEWDRRLAELCAALAIGGEQIALGNVHRDGVVTPPSDDGPERPNR